MFRAQNDVFTEFAGSKNDEKTEFAGSKNNTENLKMLFYSNITLKIPLFT